MVKYAYKGCGWHIHSSPLGNQDRFVIKIINNEHTCRVGLQDRSHPKALKYQILNIMKEKIQDMPLYKSSDIVKYIHREFGMELPYY